MIRLLFLILVVLLWPWFLAAEVPAPIFQSDTIALVPLDSGQVAGQIPVWDGEQWVFANPGVQGDQFKVDSVGSPSWENSEPAEGYDVGCLDPGACNYMPASAISFPGMCDYLSCRGCTDEQYLEYSEQALIDDGSCATKLGCLDPDADNFDPLAEGTDGSCTYSGIELVFIGEEDVLPTDLLLFELFMQGEDSLYDDIRFYVDGVLEQDTGLYMMWIAGYEPFEVHATALFEGSMRYSDTLLLDPYVSVAQVPIVFDVPIDSVTWVGEGISLVSTVDSLFVSYAQILDQSALELTCDFSSGPDFVVGTVADGDSAMWFSMTYLEAADTLTISCVKTVTALTMLMPDLAKEEETILNFVEETISSTTQFDSLVTAFSSQIQNSGVLSLSALDYVHLNQTASELKAQLPEAALQSLACAGTDVGVFKWPTLMADHDENVDGRALKYDNCGSDLSYAVQAESKSLGGSVKTSKTYVFGPDMGAVGSLYWRLGAESLPEYDESEHRLIPAIDRSRLTPHHLGLNPDAHVVTSITVKTYGLGENASDPFINDPSLSGSLIQGPLPPFSPGHDLLSHVIDAIVPLPDCGLNGLLSTDSEVNAILASLSLSGEENADEIRSYLIEQVIPSFWSAMQSVCGRVNIAKFDAWMAGVNASGSESLVSQIEPELASFNSDWSYSQSYVTHQLVMDGVFSGTPIARADQGFVLESGQVVDPVLGTANINVTEPDPYQTARSSPWYMVEGFLSPLLEHERIDEKVLAPVVRFHPFVAYHQDGALLQLSNWDQSSSSEDGLSSSYSHLDFFGFQLSAPFNLNFASGVSGDGQYTLNVKREMTPPQSSVYGGVCSPSTGQTYLQRYGGLESDAFDSLRVPRLEAKVPPTVPLYEANDPYWNGDLPTNPVLLGKVILKYEPGVVENGRFRALPNFPNRFSQWEANLPLSPVVGFPMVTTHDVHGVYASMQSDEFMYGSPYSLPYPGTTVFRDTIIGSTATFSLSFGPSEVTEIEAPLYAELTGIPSTAAVSTVSTNSVCNGCVVSLNPLRIRLDGLGKSPVDIKIDFSELHLAAECIFDIDVRLMTDCDVVLGEFEKRLLVNSPCQGQTVVTYGGYGYPTVEIGDQCWFAENLRTTTYGNGDEIPAGLPLEDWTSTLDGATCVYGEGSISWYDPGGCYSCCYSSEVLCQPGVSLEAYGRLYNWYAVDDPRGLCPYGWHVPTYEEVTELLDYVASQGFEENEGTALKATQGVYPTGWLWGWGTDDFGFSALPGGGRNGEYGGGHFIGSGGQGGFWTSSLSGGNPRSFWVDNNNAFVGISAPIPSTGKSVRCLKDDE